MAQANHHRFYSCRRFFSSIFSQVQQVHRGPGPSGHPTKPEVRFPNGDNGRRYLIYPKGLGEDRAGSSVAFKVVPE